MAARIDQSTCVGGAEEDGTAQGLQGLQGLQGTFLSPAPLVTASPYSARLPLTTHSNSVWDTFLSAVGRGASHTQTVLLPNGMGKVLLPGTVGKAFVLDIQLDGTPWGETVAAHGNQVLDMAGPGGRNLPLGLFWQGSQFMHWPPCWGPFSGGPILAQDP